MAKHNCRVCGRVINMDKGDVAIIGRGGTTYECRRHFKKYGKHADQFSFGKANSLPESYITNYGNSSVYSCGRTHYNNHDLIELSERIEENAQI